MISERFMIFFTKKSGNAISLSIRYFLQLQVHIKKLENFLNKGHINFPDEVVLGRALTKIFNTPSPAEEKIFLENIDVPRVRKIIENAPDGYLEPAVIQQLLNAVRYLL